MGYAEREVGDCKRQILAQVLILDSYEFSINKDPYLVFLRWMVVPSVVLWESIL